jgi:hypothetical protein
LSAGVRRRAALFLSGYEPNSECHAQQIRYVAGPGNQNVFYFHTFRETRNLPNMQFFLMGKAPSHTLPVNPQSRLVHDSQLGSMCECGRRTSTWIGLIPKIHSCDKTGVQNEYVENFAVR